MHNKERAAKYGFHAVNIQFRDMVIIEKDSGIKE